MSRFFKPYEGKRPYLFVSYSHRQSDEVVDTIRLLHERRCRVWYDEGIPAGSDWPKNIEQHMRMSTAVIFFRSESAMASSNCLSEIRAALKQRKRVLVLPLDDAEPNGEWAGMLRECLVLAAAPGAQERAEEVLSSGAVGRSFFRRPLEDFRWDRLGLAASLLFFALTIDAVYGVLSGMIRLPWAPESAPELSPTPAIETPSPSPTPSIDPGQWESMFPVSFPDAQQEKAVRSVLGKDDGEDVLLHDLPEITELYFCGNMTLKSLANVSFDDEGNARVNGAKVAEGKVSDLSVIGRMPYLDALALIRQPVGSLGALSSLTLLRELSLAGTAADDLGALGAQPSLEILHLEHGAARDLTALEAMRSLRTVTVSADMIPLQWNDSASFDVILVK
ncbi:MAG: TIR domain-containing protein [Oscillospiraceae bacterium]|nr:TIR domain-containing protein [Oscillospiraceae bacterium]